MRHALVFIALALLLTACAAPSMPTSSTASAPTATPSTTPAATSSLTLTPSLIPPSETSTPEAPTATPTSETSASGGLDCKLLSQSVRNGAHFGARERFSVGWKVRNSGDEAWDPDSVVFTYLGGTKMFRSQLVQLEGTVSHGQTVALVADMVAPKNTGKYTTFWTLRQGTQDFCHVSLTIYVP